MRIFSWRWWELPLRSEYIALFAKETRHHHLAVAALVFGGAMVFLFQRHVMLQGGPVLSELVVVSFFARTALVVAALFLSYRLVVLEYYSQTQRFIEALPMARGSLEIAKFLFGLAVLLVVAFIAWLMGILGAGMGEPMDARFLAIMAARLGAFTLVLWSAAFVFGLLGRLRIPLLVVALLALRLIDSQTGFELSRFGPFALLESNTFPFERDRFPVAAIAETLVVAAVLIGGGLVVALVREGSFLESLSRTMLRRERITALAMVGLAGGAWFLSKPTPEAPPFEYESDTVVRNGAGTVEVLYINDIALDVANRLFRYLEPRVRGFMATTGIDERTPVRITLSPGLDADDFRLERADFEDGIVAHANFFDTDFMAPDLGEFVFHQLLQVATHGRAIGEERHWAMDGFAQYWAVHGGTGRDGVMPTSTDPSRHGEAAGGAAPVDPLLLQALVAREQAGLSAESLRYWDITAFEVGELPAMAMASSGWRYLAEKHGAATVQQVARSLFTKRAKDDGRDWLDALIDPVEDSFERAGVSWGEFLAGWNAWLDDHLARHPYREAARVLADADAIIAPLRLADGGSGIAYFAEFAAAQDPDADCEALHVDVPPFPLAFGGNLMYKEPVALDASGRIASFTLKNVYGPGTPVTAALECRHPLAGKPLRYAIATFVMP